MGTADSNETRHSMKTAGPNETRHSMKTAEPNETPHNIGTAEPNEARHGMKTEEPNEARHSMKTAGPNEARHGMKTAGPNEARHGMKTAGPGEARHSMRTAGPGEIHQALRESGAPAHGRIVIALAGNPNSGKTTLFNMLTGANQHVGNFPGVTVEKKEAIIRENGEYLPRHSAEHVALIDLPGIYSLSPYTQEEIVSRDFIINEKPDALINIVDVMNIERGLYLSLQLMQLGTPMVIALNMMDELHENHGSVDISMLSEKVGVPVVPISASRKEGVGELLETALRVALDHRLPQVQDFCTGAVHRAIHAVAHIIEDHANKAGVAPRFAATKLIENDPPLLDALGLTEHERHTIAEAVIYMQDETGTDRKSAIADMRYEFIDGAIAGAIEKPHTTLHQDRSARIDSLLTSKYFGIPVFAGIMALIFWLTFGVIGAALSGALGLFFEVAGNAVTAALVEAGVNAVIQSFVGDAVFAGVGSVISFIPMIIVMFFFMSILEDSGYMARVAFIMDKALRKLGLSGRSIIPMILGFGCTVPAIMSARTLSSERDRKITIMLTPFMSCTAKLPIYGALAAAFFSGHVGLIVLSLYALGILVAIIAGFVLSKLVYRGNPVPFIMELPTYRLPGIRTVAILLWQRTKDFLQRAFTVIFVATIVIWFFQTFDGRLNLCADQAESMLAMFGGLIAPAFAPLGFGSWIFATAIISGFIAKETVVSSLAVLTGAASVLSLEAALPGLLSPVQAYSFLVFCLLYTPCVAAISVVGKEMGSGLASVNMVLRQTVIAWVISFLVYHICLIFT
ncbi:MAG: ferrous iron transport protein B [Clostridiales bacterium]|nr:ferrous iron transport protein B [Clostridiales bacterium]